MSHHRDGRNGCVYLVIPISAMRTTRKGIATLHDQSLKRIVSGRL
jgi:hypothetical protein